MRIAGYHKLIAVRNTKSEQIDYWLSNRMQEVSAISHDPLLISTLWSLQELHGEAPTNEINDTLRQSLTGYLLSYPSFVDIHLFDLNGYQNLFSDESTNLALTPKQVEALDQAVNTGVLVVSDVYQAHGFKTMVFCAPVYHNSESGYTQMIGLVQAEVNVDSLLVSLLNIGSELGKTGEALLVNHNGVVINSLLKKPDASLRYNINAKPATLARSGEEGIIHTTDYYGIPVLAAYTYISQVGWGFVVKQDLSEINQPLRVLLFDFVGLFVFSIIILVAMASVVAESISQPIIGIAMHAKRIQKGDFGKNAIDTSDEIGLLAKSINEMEADIQQKLFMQKGMSLISGSMVGSPSMLLFITNLIKSLANVADANLVVFFEKETHNQSGLLLLKRKWVKDNGVGFNGNQLNISNLNMVSGATIFHISKPYLNEFSELGFVFDNKLTGALIIIPLLVNNQINAAVVLASSSCFGMDVTETIEQITSTISVGYSNAKTTDRLSNMASRLFDTNQLLESQTSELQKRTAQLQQSANELEIRNIQLEIQRSEVESVSRMKSEFLSNMSHELRTPLHIILTLSGVIKKQLSNRLNTDEIEYLDAIERNGKQLLKLILDILDLSRIESGKAEPVLRPVMLTELLQNIVSNIETLAIEQQTELTFVVKNSIPMVTSDEEKLHQVFQNIIGNAIKFTNKGFVKVIIEQKSQWVVVDVIDSGIGIAKDQQPFVFEEFRQVDGSSSRNFQGAGLGLAIANKNVELMGGYIKLKSELGKGSVFSVFIPVDTEKINNFQEVVNPDTFTI